MPAVNPAPPDSTYRVQLRKEFGFAQVRQLRGYFRKLGVSHLYLPPIFTAAPGSTHGYDVSDYGSISAELGGRAGFDQLSASLRDAKLGVLLDFVPNHMGIASARNRWWRDVLERGRASVHADYFDIHWNQNHSPQHLRVLVPMLAEHYGKELENGKISVAYEGEFVVRHGDTALPVALESYPKILESVAVDENVPPADRAELRRLIAIFAQSSNADQSRQTENAAVRSGAKGRLKALVRRSAGLRTALDRTLIRLNGTVGRPGSFTALHALLEEQHYRLARWKTGAHEINYRRFFAINSLVGLRVERPEVFRAAHALLKELLDRRQVDALRIDHIDGLRRPAEYLQALQSLSAAPATPLYVIVEKILAADETLPAAWPVAGTTGYEFIARLAGVLVDPAGERAFDRIYRQFTGDTVPYGEVVKRQKRMIIAHMFANAVNNLGADLARIISADWRWRDLTRHELTTAVSEFFENLPVYRTYREDRHPASKPDRRVLERACADAIARNPLLDPQPFEFVRDLLIGRYPPATAPNEFRKELLGWVLTFQQYSGAIMAKSVEDTAFYTYVRLIALNEVGGQPEKFGGTIAEFHARNRRGAEHPRSLLTTSTHDTKLSEDVRARLYALSEIPGEWERWLNAWHEANQRHLSLVNGQPAPDRVDEYRLYQVLLGAWPLDEAEVNDDFRERLRGHFRKAVDEAKRHTSALHPNVEYLSACDDFLAGILANGAGTAFAGELRAAAHRVAGLGMINSLTQTVLKCTSPGVPDFYQGNEIWDFSLVDPDNRRPVDFDRRVALLNNAAQRDWHELLEQWRDGAIKLRLIQTLMRYRSQHVGLFSRGEYLPYETEGAHADRVVACGRVHGGESIVVVVPRLAARLGSPPLGIVWDDTAVHVPDHENTWRNLFTGRKITAAGERLLVRTLFADLPFAVLQNT